MTTGWLMRQAKDRYTKQEWTYMTSLVAPLVVHPITAGGLDTEEGLQLRDEIVKATAHELDYMVEFYCRIRRYINTPNSDSPTWVTEWLTEVEDAMELDHRPGFLVDRISEAHDQGGMAGPLMAGMPGEVMASATKGYIYYVEDLFDDAVSAVEWQANALEDD